MKTDLAHLVSTPGLLAATVLLDQIRAVVKTPGLGWWYGPVSGADRPPSQPGA